MGHAYFALTSSDDCECLASVDIDDEVQDSHCSATCSGDPTKLCGGLQGTMIGQSDDGSSDTVTKNATATVFRSPSGAVGSACSLTLTGVPAAQSATAGPTVDDVENTTVVADCPSGSAPGQGSSEATVSFNVTSPAEISAGGEASILLHGGNPTDARACASNRYVEHL